ncbi:hypothetical protein GPX89_04515 [Nocardia sp. ET3-3]|uniref:Uncharacterized protein n=1 Tax=Nocardia terrae TaxID=2675851 RepID=A0A7K1UQA6_9NOCA|nr:hypothetical protein [Nocardia terrae]MVU76504.1 hypothetical protein [Nocardia terrae]
MSTMRHAFRTGLVVTAAAVAIGAGSGVAAAAPEPATAQPIWYTSTGSAGLDLLGLLTGLLPWGPECPIVSCH